MESDVIFCPFCHKKFSAYAWSKPDMFKGLEAYECECGAYWYEGVEDECQN